MILDQIIRWQEADRHDARKLGLSASAYHLFCLIAAGDGENLSHYAASMGISTAAITGLCDRLESRGYVSRIRKKGDRRAWLVHLSDAGGEALEEIHKPKA